MNYRATAIAVGIVVALASAVLYVRAGDPLIGQLPEALDKSVENLKTTGPIDAKEAQYIVDVKTRLTKYEAIMNWCYDNALVLQRTKAGEYMYNAKQMWDRGDYNRADLWLSQLEPFIDECEVQYHRVYP
jgi:hypothetical protein